MAHHQPQRPAIGPIEPRVKAASRFWRGRIGARSAGPRVQQPCAHHRRQGEGNQEADQDGNGGGNPKLKQKTPRNARHEGHGHENHDQAEGGRHDSQRDFRRSRTGRFKWPHFLFFDETKDVFQDDDGIVDHDSHHQDEGEHRDAVERKIERTHHAEGRDHRSWNRHGGDEGGAPVSHEKQDHQAG
jgi:hypothetical protein